MMEHMVNRLLYKMGAKSLAKNTPNAHFVCPHPKFWISMKKTVVREYGNEFYRLLFYFWHWLLKNLNPNWQERRYF
jgi:hypothetical protein